MVSKSQDRQTTSTDLMAGVIPDIEHRPECPRSTSHACMVVSDAGCLCYEVGLYNAGLDAALTAINDNRERHVNDDSWNEYIVAHCDRLAALVEKKRAKL